VANTLAYYGTELVKRLGLIPETILLLLLFVQINKKQKNKTAVYTFPGMGHTFFKKIKLNKYFKN